MIAPCKINVFRTQGLRNTLMNCGDYNYSFCTAQSVTAGEICIIEYVKKYNTDRKTSIKLETPVDNGRTLRRNWLHCEMGCFYQISYGELKQCISSCPLICYLAPPVPLLLPLCLGV